ncbi:MAG TPA: sigma-54 dependent transcriptional regulator [Myxococcota bacterium]|nr:sigma-54 dependent transcriptional regulator [Myxococcota bacterium]
MARVLIAHGERSLRAGMAIALRRAGHEAETVASLAEAVAALRDERFDAVVTADALEDGSGLALLAAVKQRQGDAAVLVVTQAGSIEDAVDAMQRGASHYLRLPIADAALVAEVGRAVERKAEATDPTHAEPAPAAEEPAPRGAIVGRSPALRAVLELAQRVAATDSTVLVTGETGTGKELVGRTIHLASRRSARVFCALNSAAFPETLLESELFGHRRGAFTGASANKQGLLEAAHGGTVFLDEVAEMPHSMQAKLLRFLQTGEIRAVGGESTRTVDVRLVTATNKDLEREVAAGRFRQDLYYRLAVIPIHVPPLRERREDVALLAEHFLARFAGRLGKTVSAIEPEALARLEAYAWPGNVRELENTIERGVALCRGAKLGIQDLPPRLQDGAPTGELASRLPVESLEDVERRHILETLARVGGSRRRAAALLQISTTTLWRRLKEFGVPDEPGDG